MDGTNAVPYVYQERTGAHIEKPCSKCTSGLPVNRVDRMPVIPTRSPSFYAEVKFKSILR